MSILLQLFRKIGSLILFIVCFTLTCYGSGDTTKNTEILSKQKMIRVLDATLDTLKNDARVQDFRNLSKRYIETTEQFVTHYPDEKKGAYYMDIAALIAVQILNEPAKAVKIYDFLIINYPDFDKMEEVLYVKAVTLDLDLRKKEEAIEAYQSLLERFPETKYREDAEARIQNIDLSSEDIINGN